MEPNKLILLQLLSTYLERPVADLVDLDGFDELDLDSIGLLDLVGLVEERFSVRFPDEALDHIHSLTDLLHVLEKQVAHVHA